MSQLHSPDTRDCHLTIVTRVYRRREGSWNCIDTGRTWERDTRRCSRGCGSNLNNPEEIVCETHDRISKRQIQCRCRQSEGQQDGDKSSELHSTMPPPSPRPGDAVIKYNLDSVHGLCRTTPPPGYRTIRSLTLRHMQAIQGPYKIACNQGWDSRAIGAIILGALVLGSDHCPGLLRFHRPVERARVESRRLSFTEDH